MTHLYYIAGGMYVKQFKGATILKDGMYYVHPDHLGSFAVITDAAGAIKQQCTFDAWGKRSFTVKDPSLVFDRGFTGHEHLDEFELINMNARLYDPMLGRVLQPDIYVANPFFTQDYNRYTYAGNNPLIYKDPTGEFIIAFIVNGIRGAVNGTGFWKTGGQAIGNHFMIIGGLFTTDKNRNGLGQTLEVISRFTWQGIQTGVGHLYSQFANMTGQIDHVSYKAGATVMSGNFWGKSKNEGIALGSYIHGTSNLAAEFGNSSFQHEYGHYLQSQASGPLYFQRYGIPSALKGSHFKNRGDHNNRIYYHPVEQDANARAFKYFSEKVTGFNSVNEHGGRVTQWDFNKNPIIGYNPELAFNDALNQKALQYARFRPAWHDWVLGPNIALSGLAINLPVSNSKKYYHNKLDLMKKDGFDIYDWFDWYYNFE